MPLFAYKLYIKCSVIQKEKADFENLKANANKYIQ